MDLPDAGAIALPDVDVVRVVLVPLPGVRVVARNRLDATAVELGEVGILRSLPLAQGRSDHALR